MIRTLMNRQHARVDVQCKQSDGNFKNKSKTNARDQKHCHCNRNEDHLISLLADWTWLKKEFLSLRVSQQKSSEKQREQKLKNKNTIHKNCGTTPKGVTYEKWNRRRRKKERNEKQNI